MKYDIFLIYDYFYAHVVFVFEQLMKIISKRGRKKNCIQCRQWSL